METKQQQQGQPDKPRVLNFDMMDVTLDFVGFGQKSRFIMPTSEEVKKMSPPFSTLDMELDPRGVLVRYVHPKDGKKCFLVPMAFIKRVELEP